MDQGFDLLCQLLDIYDINTIVDYLKSHDEKWTKEDLKKWVKTENDSFCFTDTEYKGLEDAFLPRPSQSYATPDFTFIDLFAGIGGIRKGFDAIGGKCLLTSEWNKFSVRTYKANHYSHPSEHIFNSDIKDITLSNNIEISEEDAYKHIDKVIPDHEVLLAGFPCQPFSIAGVSKKNSMGIKHGFECETQGTLFFDVARIIKAKQPVAFVLENVKNLKSHDKGNTFRVIMKTLDELGYHVADHDSEGARDPKIIDAKNFLPQHRERIVLVGFRKDLGVHKGFSLKNIKSYFPKNKPKLKDLLEENEAIDPKYILSPKLWRYLNLHAAKHKAKGNGFGYGLVNGDDISRTLSARYYKDGSEILIDRGWKDNMSLESDKDMEFRPRRLTPRECSRLMGFDNISESNFKIPVSDTQAYRQFGNSVAVPVFSSIAKLMRERILKGKKINKENK